MSSVTFLLRSKAAALMRGFVARSSTSPFVCYAQRSDEEVNINETYFACLSSGKKKESTRMGLNNIDSNI